MNAPAVTIGPLYLRRERTTDSTTLRMNPRTKKMDVVYYADRVAKRQMARTSWFHANKPRRGCKYATLNCVRWPVVWLEDLKTEETVAAES